MAIELTAGQEGVLHMYDTEIRGRKMERDFSEKLGHYDDVHYYTVRIEELQEERAMVLDKFIAERS